MVTDLTKGRRIGNYEIVGPLGTGGMGEVYRARDIRLDRIVAIKALPSGFARDAERLSRFEREARLLASLSHPNVAAIYGLEDAKGSPYLVLEFIEGETLARRLSRGALPTEEVLKVGIQIASAIEAAHERGVVHRDLKPGNIMLTPQGAIKVLDFGLAKGGTAHQWSQDPSSTPTGTMTATAEGMILGTTPYMSPEQARGKPVDRRTDVWAFGCVLFECLTGRQAFAGETTEARRLIMELESSTGLGAGNLMMAAGAALRIGEQTRAIRFMTRNVIGDLGPTLVRLAPKLHALLDREPFAPRRWNAALVWPLEAPGLDDARLETFQEVRVESGLPKGSDILSGL